MDTSCFQPSALPERLPEPLPRNLPFLMGLPSFPTSRWLDPSHQISACLDERFLRFSCRGSDIRKDHFAQSRTVVGKAENEPSGCSFLPYFLSPHLPHRLILMQRKEL